MLSFRSIQSQSFDAFLFDMDGTILDSSAASERVWGGWARENGIPTPPYHGRRVEDTMADLTGFGINPKKGASEITQRELDDLAGVVAIPGAAEFLKMLPPRKWAVVTSAPKQLALRRIAAAGLPLPDAIVAAEDVTRGKPQPDPFLAGARLLSVDPARCLVFEDADAGIHAAEAAGASVLVITHTNSSTLQGRASVADYLGLRVEHKDSSMTIVAQPSAA
ncbi:MULTISPECIES: HAD-IA family hydrolase [unclassified Agrobacterium]|uniref:HAD-IA family hydrolase n=1 Tax=unclassified Agrobacterium TaxID=2632611 RepID=UPI0024473836|nr:MULTISPECIES: HAD-IA family hydrolase [unclassified Agrobacterium]MDH0613792.1 HAD-IA family hydrolase [Agrobacterium sp. GD03872]MDH0696681.1 HAD-IA family hydrolase [Agrobacterium sp. GD03871]MDH1060155.1 HAD-IA family hydrolase [Agrobacterium sp. GD03992]MDH2210068.1 HAD-IA family hydrolase [Agrobacterium sp. GD03643]MDH2219567.1 HAD-IA family hydrolase [Agrobacterium sp. GD03638]